MPLDANAIGGGCKGATIESANHLCRAELERFSSAAAKGGEITVACTQEAKLCPDGSYVGRTGPNCEFAQCP